MAYANEEEAAMNRSLLLLALVFVVLATGCRPPVYAPPPTPEQLQAYEESRRRNTPPKLVADESRAVYLDPQVEVAMSSPLGDDGWRRAFAFAVANKTRSEMKVIWDETYFIENGKQNGRFMSRGVPYDRRDEPRVADVILPGQVIGVPLWPNVYVSGNASSSRGGNTAWRNEPLRAGEYGISVVIQTAKGKKRILVTVTLREENAY